VKYCVIVCFYTVFGGASGCLQKEHIKDGKVSLSCR